jgi:hypothetical protein
MAGSIPPPELDAPVVHWTPSSTSPIAIRRMLGETFARYGADPWRLIGLAIVPALVTTAFAAQAPIALFGTLLSLLSWSVMLVLADAGPHRLALIPAIRRGLGRSGRLLLALLGILLVAAAAAFVPAMIATAAVTSSLALFAVGLLTGAVVSLLAFGRLGLAIPATVVDGLSARQALGRARTLTRSRGAFLRVAGAYLVVVGSVNVVNAAIGFLRGLDVGPTAVVVLIGTVAIAIVSPLPPLLLLVLYRRLAQVVDPLDEIASLKLPPLIKRSDDPGAAATVASEPADLLAEPAPVPAFDVPLEPTGPAWMGMPPALGLSGRVLALAVAATFVAGLAAFVWSGSQLRTVVPATAVPPGEVQFGSESSLATCTIPHPATVFGRGAPVAWIARYSRPTTALDVVRLRVTRDGSVIIDEQERPQAAACLGTSKAETGVIPGTYEFTVTVNDEVRAIGSFSALQ